MSRAVKYTTKQQMALALSFCFFLVCLLSELFILTHSNHTHDHNGFGGTCTTCTRIQNVENALKQLGMAVVVGIILSAGYYAENIKPILPYITALTPITAKIRLNI